jgi:hypothetical protein
MPKGLEIYDQPRGGSVIAKFTGAKSTVEAAKFPIGSGAGRVSVRTGSGTGGFRIEGFVEADELPLYTKQRIRVPGGVMWLGQAQRVEFGGATPSELVAKLQLSGRINQTFVGTAACSAFTLTPGTQPAWSPGGHDRACTVKRSRLDLFYGPDRKGGPSSMLKGARGLQMWRDRPPSRGFIHVEHHGPVVIDAWARASDLECLPPGERHDVAVDSLSRHNQPQLALAGSTRVVTARKELPIRAAPKATAPVIGAVEKRCQTYVVDIVAGWASVLPKSLDIATNGTDHFWVKASDLGL